MNKIRVLSAAISLCLSASAFAVDEVIYFSDTLQVDDGKSALYRVEIDPISHQANLFPLPTGTIPADGVVEFDHVDALAAESDGSILWLINSRGNIASQLIKYTVANALVENIGLIHWPETGPLGDIDQAAVSPDGTLYVTRKNVDYLYTVNTSDAIATRVGKVEGADTTGGDIAFDQYGALYLLNQTGLYELTLPAVIPSPVIAVNIGPSKSGYTGMAFRSGGFGNVLASNKETDTFDELSVIDAAEVSNYPMMYPNGTLYDHSLGGDMTTGPLVICSKTIGYWKNHSWNGAVVTINDMPYNETSGRFGSKVEGDKPYDGLLWQAKGKTYSMLYAQLIAAKLNTNNSYTIDILNQAEMFLDGKDFSGIVDKSEKSDYSALVQAVTAFNEDNHCDADNEDEGGHEDDNGGGEEGSGGEY